MAWKQSGSLIKKSKNIENILQMTTLLQEHQELRKPQLHTLWKSVHAFECNGLVVRSQLQINTFYSFYMTSVSLKRKICIKYLSISVVSTVSCESQELMMCFKTKCAMERFCFPRMDWTYLLSPLDLFFSNHKQLCEALTFTPNRKCQENISSTAHTTNKQMQRIVNRTWAAKCTHTIKKTSAKKSSKSTFPWATYIILWPDAQYLHKKKKQISICAWFKPTGVQGAMSLETFSACAHSTDALHCSNLKRWTSWKGLRPKALICKIHYLLKEYSHHVVFTSFFFWLAMPSSWRWVNEFNLGDDCAQPPNLNLWLLNCFCHTGSMFVHADFT